MFCPFYTYPDSDSTAVLCAPWATSLRCHGAPGAPAVTLRRTSYDSMATCFRGDLTALVLSMFKTWRRPWRPHCNLQRSMSGDQRWSGWFCRSQRGRRPLWLGYYHSKSVPSMFKMVNCMRNQLLLPAFDTVHIAGIANALDFTLSHQHVPCSYQADSRTWLKASTGSQTHGLTITYW